MKPSWSSPALPIGIFLGVAGIVVAYTTWQNRPSESFHALVDANPGWEIRRVKFGQLAVTEIATGAHFLIDAAEAGPYTMKGVPCADLKEATPVWFRLPPDAADAGRIGCLRLSAPGREVYVTNFHTKLGVPEIWTDFYEPLLGDYPFDHSGGGSTSVERTSEREAASGPDGDKNDAPILANSRRFSNVIGYSVTPYDRNSTRQTHLSAFYVDGKPTVVVAFRSVAQ